MARGVADLELDAGHAEGVPVVEGAVRGLVREDGVPQHAVVRVDQHRGVHHLAELHDLTDVVVVAVGQQDRQDLAAADGLPHGVRVMGGVDDHALLGAADDPDVVVHLVGLPVQGEGAGGDDVVDACHQSTTTERRTSPAFMVSKASFTSSMPIFSVTN